MEFKYSEDKILKEVAAYIEGTYDQHYNHGKYQATEFIIDAGRGEGFLLGNILKYAQRYGKKGKPEDWRKDLMKVVHYGIMAIHDHDLRQKK